MNVPFRRLWRLFAAYLRPHWRWTLLLALLLFAGIGLELAGPQILRRFIDTAQAGSPVDQLFLAGVLYLVVGLVAQATAVAETYTAELVGWRATNHLRADLALHCLRLDYAFHTRRTPGELIERVDGDVGTLAGFFSRFVLVIVGNALLLLGVLALLLRLDWRIGLAGMAFSCLATPAMLRLYVRALPVWAAARQVRALFFGAVGEALTATEDIAASNAAAFILHRLHERVRRWTPLVVKATFAEQAVWMVALSLFALAKAVSLLVGAGLFRGGAISLGAVYLIAQYFNLLSQPIGAIQAQIQQFQQAGACVGRIEELFRLQPQVRDGAHTLPDGALSVELDGIHFAYDESGEVLRDFTLHLAPGSTLGLLGRTGSGKSTLVRLLGRLVEPGAGTIRLGGVSLGEVALLSLRQRVGVVTQEVQLFQGTIRDNLTFFQRTISDPQLLTAIEQLGLLAWLRALPAGLESELSSQHGLSAGQAQILALVRVFLQDPGLVILDEASSRLDPITEAHVNRALTGLLRGRTGVIIAHRLAAVRHVDAIAILDDGQLVEHGRRAALAADPSSRFAALLRLEQAAPQER